MNFDEYKQAGRQVVDYIAEYFETIRERRVFPDVEPGYLRQLVPNAAPQEGDSWNEIFGDIERVIMPGVTHWQSPHMHAYFPALNSFPSLLGEMISEAINCISFTWASSPAATELESLLMDWMVKMLDLPKKFLYSNAVSGGGGVLQTSVSESTYYAMLAARTKIFHQYSVGDIQKYDEKSVLNGRLICYCSNQAHSSVEKAALVALIRIKILTTDDDLSLRGDILQEEINKDLEQGLIPFFVCATLGTTGACAFDNLKEIGEICSREGIWLHVDAAYAGTSFLCPEYRHFMSGIEYANSFVFNASKWMLVNFDCACFWVDCARWLHQTFSVTPLYLAHKYSNTAIDYMHWQVGLSRRFRAIKLWFVIRSFGLKGLQDHVRKGVRLAKLFEDLVCDDQNFEIPAKRHLGLVVFRLRGENEITESLLKKLNKDGRLHVVPASIKNLYVIRFAVTSQYTTENDIRRDWNIIRLMGNRIILEHKMQLNCAKFQSSLVLSNVPHTPKFVNSSFLAFLSDSEVIYDIMKDLKLKGYVDSKIPLTSRYHNKLMQKRLSYCSLKNEEPGSTNQHKNCLFKWNLKERKNELKQQTSLDSKIDNIFEEMEKKRINLKVRLPVRLTSHTSSENGIIEDDEKDVGDCNDA